MAFQRLGVKINGSGFQAPPIVPLAPVDQTANQVAALQQRLAAAPPVDTRNGLEKLLNLNPNNQGWVGDVLQTIGRPFQAIDSGIHGAISAPSGDKLSGFMHGLGDGISGNNQPLTTDVSISDPRTSLERALNLNPNNGFTQDVLETASRLGNAFRTGVKQDWQALDQFKQNNGGLNAGNVLDAAKSTLGAFGTGFHEGLTGNDHTSAQDAIPQQFRQDHPNLSALAGLAGDVVTDPSSFIPVGAAAKGIGKVTGMNALASAAGDALTGTSKMAARDAGMSSIANKVGQIDKSIADIHAQHDATMQNIPTPQELANPHIQPLKDVNQTTKEIQTQHDNFAKMLLNDANAAHEQGIVKAVKDAGVRRPLKGDSFYAEYQALPEHAKSAFKSGNTGRGALSLDEFASANKSDANSVLDALKNSQPKYKLADVLNHPELQNMRASIDGLNMHKADVQAARDAFHAEQQVSKQAYADTAKAAEDAKAANLSPLEAEKQKLASQYDKLVATDGRNSLQKAVGNVKDTLGELFVPKYAADKVKDHKTGATLGDMFRSFDKNAAYLTDRAIKEGEQLVKRYKLKESDRQALARAIENPGSVADARIQGASAAMKNITDAWHALATKHGYDVGYIENYVKHLLTPEGRQLLKQYGKTTSMLPFGKTSPQTFKSKIEASREDGRNIDQINAASQAMSGFDMVEKDAVKAMMAGDHEKARAIAAQGLMNEVSKVFGIPFQEGQTLPKGYSVFNLSDKSLFGIEGKIALPDEVVKELSKLMEPQTTNKLTQLMKWVNGSWKTITLLNPSFHLGNLGGGFFNNALAGVTNPARYAEALQIILGKGSATINGKKMTAAEINGLYAREGLNGHGQFSDMANSLQNQLDWSAKKTSEKIGSSVNPAHPLQSLKNISNYSRDLGSGIEKFLRMTHFISKMDEGLSPAAAAKSVNKYMFDYADLTKSEQAWKNTAMPFYTWTRKNVPLQILGFLTNTKMYNIRNYAVQNQAQAQNIDMSKIPSYLKDQLALPLYKDDQGNVQYLADRMPLQDLAKLNPNDFAKNLVGMFGPLLKTPFETVTNKDTFTGAPIQQFDGQTTDFLGMNVSPMFAHNLQALLPPLRDANKTLTPTIDKLEGKTKADTGQGPNIPVLSSFVKTDNPTKDAQSYNMNEIKRLGDMVKARNAQQIQQMQDAGATPQQIADLKKNQDAAHGFVPTMKDLAVKKTKTISIKKGKGRSAAKPRKASVRKPRKVSAPKPRKVSVPKPKMPKASVPKTHKISSPKTPKNLGRLRTLKKVK